MIFISYSSKDFEKADLIRSILEGEGFECWMAPQSIPTGGDYATFIPPAIRECDVFLLLLTDNAQKSVWVPKELDIALSHEKTIIPVQLGNVTLTDAFDFRLTNVQRNLVINEIVNDCNRVVARVHELLGDGNGKKNEAPSVNEDSGHTFRVYLYNNSTSHILTEKNVNTGSDHYNFSEDKWKEFSLPIKRVLSILMGVDAENIQLKRKSSLGLKKCVSLGDLSFEDAYSVCFGVNSLTEGMQLGYDGFHFVIEGTGLVKLSLFLKGKYVFHNVPDDTKITHFGIDEQALIQAIRDLVRVVEGCPNIRMGDHFYTKVYSDKSGGYQLKYLTED